MPLVLGGSSAPAEPYVVANSCRFDMSASAYFNLTFGTPTDNDKWSFSCWVKRSGGLDINQYTLVGASDGSNYTEIHFQPTNKFRVGDYQGGGLTAEIATDRLFRDPTGWMHILYVYDSGNGVAGDRMKLYINGTEETSFSTDTNPSVDQSSMINSAVSHTLGSNVAEGGTVYFDGYMAEVVFCDGQAYSPSDFGEFDSDSPAIWKPKDPSGLTFGDNGCYLDFEDSADLGADVSGKSNDWTANNISAVDQATDTPTNNFCTLNSLITRTTYPPAFSMGNCKISTNGDWGVWPGTLGAMKGKWYWEVTCFGAQNVIHGVVSEFVTQQSPTTGTGYLLGSTTQYEAVGWSKAGRKYPGSGGASSAYFTAYANGNILSVAMDLDNGKLYFAKAGTWENSGDPTSGATGTGSASNLTLGTEFFFPGVGPYNSTDGFFCNFGGCPAFTVSSAVADANGYGAFEYAPPTGYYALCTRNLAEFG